MIVFLVILIFAFALQSFLPWWIIIVVSFAVCGIVGKTSRISFLQPFLAIFLLWTALALYKSIPNHHILANRIAEMFGVHQWYFILAITSILGAFVAGISGLCGYHFRKSILK